MTDNLPPDPTIRPILTCPGKKGRPCGYLMNPLNVYRGLGTPSKRHQRGSLCQTCSNFDCLYTVHHTPPYNFDDAQRLLKRIQYPGDPSGFPRTLRPPASDQPLPNNPQTVTVVPPIQPLVVIPQTQPPAVITQPAIIAQPTQSIGFSGSGRIDCAQPDCVTRSQTRSAANRSCIEAKCKKCCIKSARIAMENGFARRACQTHGQSEIPGSATSINTIVRQPTTSSLSQPAFANTTSTQPPNQANATIMSTVSQPFHPPIPPQATQSTSAVSGGVGRRLAQPVGGTWAHKRTNPLVGESQNVKTLKVQQHEMDEQRKRTCTLVVYHTNGEPPIRIDQYIPSFPHFRISAFSSLMKDLEIESSTRLDFWTGEWLTISVDSVITVDRGQRVLLKIRPSLRKTLEDCPGIEAELELQPGTGLSRSLKRHGNDLVSPIRKAVQSTQALDIESENHNDSGLFVPTTEIVRQLEDKTLTTVVERQKGIIRKTSTVAHAGTTQDDSLNPMPISQHSSRMDSKPVKLRRWPFDFKVYQIHNGLTQMKAMLDKARIKSTHSKYTIQVKDVFQAAFPRAVYKKTTFYEHRELWEKYDTDIVNHFVDLGDSTKATYANLLKALKDPNNIPDDSVASNTSDIGDPQHRDSRSRSRSTSVSSNSTFNDTEQHTMSPTNLTTIPNDNTSLTSSEIPTKTLPKPIPNVNNLRQRVYDMKEVLEAIISEPEESQFFCSARDSYRPSSSQVRMSNHNENLLYCNSFYGSHGHSIIFASLEILFLINSLDMDLLAPLSRYVAMTEFLIPETVVLLIQEELRISADDVLRVARDRYIDQSSTIANTKLTRQLEPSHSPPSDLSKSPVPIVKAEVSEIVLPPQENREVIDLTLDSDDEDDIYC